MIAYEHLSRSDSILAQLIRKCEQLRCLEVSNQPFDDLVRSIIGQQLSVKAARSISGRLETQIGRPFTPLKVASRDLNQLRAIGISKSKATYILSLAEGESTERLNLNSLLNMREEDVVEDLLRQKGIGLWTAQMFLIFACGKPDVLATADAGLRRAIRIFYNTDLRDKSSFETFALKWRPYRSYASLVLWSALDTL